MAAEIHAQVSIDTANTNTTVFTTDHACTMTVRILNRTDSQMRAWLAFSSTATPTDSEYIEYNALVEPYDTLVNTDIHVGIGHNVVVRVSKPGASVFVSGI